MKTKFKEFIKKIKNWLSSLSKWAQKNKLKLFACVFLIFLAICTMGTCTANKKRASAQNLTSSSSVLVLPNITLNYQINGQVTTFPIFLGVKDDNIIIYRPMQNDTYEPRRLSSRESGYVGFNAYYIDNYSFLGYRYSASSINQKEVIDLNINNQPSHIWLYINEMFTSINDAFLNMPLLATELYYSFQTMTDTEFYYYINGVVNGENVRLLEMQIYDVRPLVSSVRISTIPLFVSSNVSFEYVSQQIIQQSYTEGYSLGFYNGNKEGYQIGFNDGIEHAVDPSHFEPFYILTNAVSSFLNTHMFGSVTLGTLLSIGLGCILFGFAIKIFLGG